jgi:hypothetical protein
MPAIERSIAGKNSLIAPPPPPGAGVEPELLEVAPLELEELLEDEEELELDEDEEELEELEDEDDDELPPTRVRSAA